MYACLNSTCSNASVCQTSWAWPIAATALEHVHDQAQKVKGPARYVVTVPVMFLLAKAEPGHRCKAKKSKSSLMLTLQLLSMYNCKLVEYSTRG